MSYISQVTRSILSGVDSLIHLRQAAAKAAAGGTVNVAIAGDSTGAGTPAAVMSQDGIWYNLIRKFREDNPGVNLVFNNFAIPDAGESEYLGPVAPAHQAYVSGTWLFNPDVNWNTYVKGNAPDILIFCFGVNTSFNTASGTYQSMLNMANWLPVPDVIFITCTPANPAAGSPYGDANYQAGYYGNPSLVRALIASKGLAACRT